MHVLARLRDLRLFQHARIAEREQSSDAVFYWLNRPAGAASQPPRASTRYILLGTRHASGPRPVRLQLVARARNTVINGKDQTVLAVIGDMAIFAFQALFYVRLLRD